MDNLKVYNAVREVPQEAQTKIMGGRLKGFTDINPVANKGTHGAVWNVRYRLVLRNKGEVD